MVWRCFHHQFTMVYYATAISWWSPHISFLQLAPDNVTPPREETESLSLEEVTSDHSDSLSQYETKLVSSAGFNSGDNVCRKECELSRNLQHVQFPWSKSSNWPWRLEFGGSFFPLAISNNINMFEGRKPGGAKWLNGCFQCPTQ